ncbi:hypothetical protein HID58_070447 [Brassica napus]|uniref:CN hydrolase domain-containing protein n=1 Tax=Brassica napus TaxID=3708 RepID=A0ABQ7YYW0_BRANA|nr:hypothetical protein HID58_070447 [Brassica napus]
MFMFSLAAVDRASCPPTRTLLFLSSMSLLAPGFFVPLLLPFPPEPPPPLVFLQDLPVACSSCDLPDSHVPPDPPDLLPSMCHFLSSAAPATPLSACSYEGLVLGVIQLLLALACSILAPQTTCLMVLRFMVIRSVNPKHRQALEEASEDGLFEFLLCDFASVTSPGFHVTVPPRLRQPRPPMTGTPPSSLRDVGAKSSKLWRRRNQTMEKKMDHRLHTSLFPRSSVVDMKERRRFEDSDGIIQLGVVICEDLSAANRGELLAAACDFGLRLFMPSYVEDSNSLNHVLDESTTSPSSAETVSHRFWRIGQAGDPYQPQEHKFKRGVDIVVETPGRIKNE